MVGRCPLAPRALPTNLMTSGQSLARHVESSACLDGWGTAPYKSIRPSGVPAALKIMRTGEGKRSDFCVAYFQFPVGKLVMAAAEEVVKGHAGDILADSSFSAAQALMEFAALAQLCDVTDEGVVLERQGTIATALSKLSSALSTWSPSRTEEQWADVQSLISRVLHSSLHAVALATSKTVAMVSEPLGMADKDAQEIATQALPNDEPLTLQRNVMERLRAPLHRARTSTEDLISLSAGDLRDLMGFLAKMATIAKLHGDTIAEFSASIMEDIIGAEQWSTTLTAM